MRPPSAPNVRRILLSGLASVPLMTASAAEVPISPAMAERILERRGEVAAGLREIIETNGDSGKQALSSLADTNSPDWRLYYRDRQLMFAVPTRRTVTALEKTVGEEEARDLAAVMLQQQFSRLLDLDPTAALDEKSIRVVFIEPDVYRGRSEFIGFAGQPLPMYPAGYWPSGWASQGGCGCR
jgi:hypothetical protein